MNMDDFLGNDFTEPATNAEDPAAEFLAQQQDEIAGMWMFGNFNLIDISIHWIVNFFYINLMF